MIGKTPDEALSGVMQVCRSVNTGYGACDCYGVRCATEEVGPPLMYRNVCLGVGCVYEESS